jgi:hypothetical protein
MTKWRVKMVRIITNGKRYRIQKLFFLGWKTLGVARNIVWRLFHIKGFEPYEFESHEHALKAKQNFCGTLEKLHTPEWQVAHK